MITEWRTSQKSEQPTLRLGRKFGITGAGLAAILSALYEFWAYTLNRLPGDVYTVTNPILNFTTDFYTWVNNWLFYNLPRIMSTKDAYRLTDALFNAPPLVRIAGALLFSGAVGFAIGSLATPVVRKIRNTSTALHSNENE